MTSASNSRRGTEGGANAGLEAYDRLATEFLANHPDDPRRWNVLFFDGVNAEARAKAGMPARGDPAAIMEEILKAADASAKIKADASAVGYWPVTDPGRNGRRQHRMDPNGGGASPGRAPCIRRTSGSGPASSK